MVRPGMGDIDTACDSTPWCHGWLGGVSVSYESRGLFIFSRNSHLWMKIKENVFFFWKKWWIVGNVCSVCTFFKCGATLFVDMRVFRVPKWCLWHAIMLIYGMKSMLASVISVPYFPLIHYRDVHLHHKNAKTSAKNTIFEIKNLPTNNPTGFRHKCQYQLNPPFFSLKMHF